MAVKAVYVCMCACVCVCVCACVCARALVTCVAEDTQLMVHQQRVAAVVQARRRHQVVNDNDNNDNNAASGRGKSADVDSSVGVCREAARQRAPVVHSTSCLLSVITRHLHSLTTTRCRHVTASSTATNTGRPKPNYDQCSMYNPMNFGIGNTALSK